MTDTNHSTGRRAETFAEKSKPPAYANFDYLWYFQKVRLYCTRPALLLHQHVVQSTEIPIHDCHLPMNVVERTEDEQCVQTIRSVSLCDIEQFSLRLLIIIHAWSCYEDQMNSIRQQSGMYIETVIASELLVVGTQFDIHFQESVQIYSTPEVLWILGVTLYRQGASLDKVAVKNGKALYGDIHTGYDQQRKHWMYLHVEEVSDWYSRRLLRDNSFFTHHILEDGAELTETYRITTTLNAFVVQNASTLQSRYGTLNLPQGQVIYTVIAALQQLQ